MRLHTLLRETPVGAALEYLRNEIKIHVVEDSRAGLVSLKYNQFESPMDNPLVAECRGAVVDITDDRGELIAWPYDKFWNLGEPLAAEIDWRSAQAAEKLDGSLMILYHRPRDHTWMVASSGHPTAGGSFGSADRTFREAFWDTFAVLGMRLPDRETIAIKTGFDALRLTYMLELCDQPNRIVVRHPKPRLVLHGVRELATGKYLCKSDCEWIAASHNWEYVKWYPLAGAEAVVTAAAALDPLETEGFVVVDHLGNRVKVKSPRYVMLHQMKGEATLRRSIELWQSGETSELAAAFPEIMAEITPVHDFLDEIAKTVFDTYVKHCPLIAPDGNRKAFAEQVKHLPTAPILFRLAQSRFQWEGYHREGALPTVKSIMRNQTVSALERMIDLSRPIVIGGEVVEPLPC